MARSVTPPLTLDLTWQGETRFLGRAGRTEVVLDGAGAAGPSPVQTLALGLAACMASDVVEILTKGRLPLRALRAQLVGERRSEAPRAFTRIDLHFVVTGDIPPERIDRALSLSRQKYCSVSHSLRPDIDLRTSFEIQPAASV